MSERKWGGTRPGAGRPKGSKGGGRPPLNKNFQLGDPITVVVIGPEPGAQPMAFTGEIARLDKHDGKATLVAIALDGTTITVQ